MPATKDIFAKYPNNVFIETGSYKGDGIQSALDAGFTTIYSFELSFSLHSYCVNRFRHNPNVHLVLGESHKMMKLVLKKINEPATFWLDGHYSGPHTAMGEFESPLLQELKLIADHPIKTHTILIDDLRCWSIEKQGFNTETLKSYCLNINKDYKFSFETTQHYTETFIDDILVAQS